jgi:DNA-binding CsgD family transcriptional regulator
MERTTPKHRSLDSQGRPALDDAPKDTARSGADPMPKPEAARAAFAAEEHFPARGQAFLRALEETRRAVEVWELVVGLGRAVDLPMVDFISASDWRDWKRTLFVRTSYDASWLHEYNRDPDRYRWSYFRNHGIDRLTPITVGLAFLDDYHAVPPARVDILREAARRGMRAGISIPLRQSVPPSAAMMTFTGDHDREALLEILAREGWSLTVGAWAAHQRYLQHFSAEFFERNRVTEKQRELLEMIGAGWPDRRIAGQLEISVSAVRQRLNALLQKTGTRNRAELAALAMSLGLLPAPQSASDVACVTLVQSDVGGSFERGGDEDQTRWPQRS